MLFLNLTIQWDAVVYIGIGAVIGFISSIIIFKLNIAKERKTFKIEIVSNLVELIPIQPEKRLHMLSDLMATEYWSRMYNRDPDSWEIAEKELVQARLSLRQTTENDQNLNARLNKYYYLYQEYFKETERFDELYDKLVNYEHEIPDINKMELVELRKNKPSRLILEAIEYNKKVTDPIIQEILDLLIIKKS